MACSDFEHPALILDLGRGTRIQLIDVHDIRERKPDEFFIPLDYAVVNRGRLSRRAMKKKMTRWFHHILWEAVGKRPPGDDGGAGLSARLRRKITANKRWVSKNMRLHQASPLKAPAPDVEPPHQSPAVALPAPSTRAYFTPLKRHHLNAAESAPFFKTGSHEESLENLTR